MEVTASAAAPRSTTSFWWARLGSFLSIFPLGIWVVNHLWDNLAVLSGGQAWQASVTGYAHPFAHWGVVVMVFLPLILHAAWGIQRLFTSRPNNQRYGYFENFKYLLQRAAAVGALAFICAHVWLALIEPRVIEGHAETFQDISLHMRYHLPTLLVYLAGTVGVTYHLANGLFGFAWTWGLLSGRKSFRLSNTVQIAVFLILTLMAWLVVWGLYTAGGHLPPPTHPL